MSSPLILITIFYVTGTIVAYFVSLPKFAIIFSLFLTGFLMVGLFFICSRRFFIGLLLVFFLLGFVNFQIRGDATRLSTPLIGFIDQLKQKLVQVQTQTLPVPYAALSASMIFGSSAVDLPSGLKETYRKAGVSHLLVASGMQVSLLVGSSLFLLRLAGCNAGLTFVLATFFNLLCVLITGAGASILRAAIMAQMALLATLFEREKDAVVGLGFSAFILLIFNPNDIFNVGFQLSFAATWSLLSLAPMFERWFKPVLQGYLSSLLAISLAPFLVTFPIILFHFGQINPFGIVTNFIVLPWVSVLVIFGALASLAGLFFMPLAQILSNCNLILLWLLQMIINFMSQLPGSEMFFPAPSVFLVIIYYLLLWWRVNKIPNLKKWRINFRQICLLLLLCAAFLFCSAFYQPSHNLNITVLDVGEGDAILVEMPAGEKMLIDGGNYKAGYRQAIPFLRRRGIGKLDWLVISHPHADHLGGAGVVAQKMLVKKVIQSPFDFQSQTYSRFMDLLHKNKIKYAAVAAGQSFEIGQGVNLTLFAPQPDAALPRNANNGSLVFKLRYGDFSMLFTGDNENVGEKEILKHFEPGSLKALVLKVAHHGSHNATSSDFLAAVAPSMAIISCGKKNRYGHPHQATLQRLKNAGIKVYRTDEEGNIRIATDGKTVRKL